ncbi:MULTISPECIES: 6,7-dimethyl-8-ribityllumazine synthase [unclassified Rhizobium]|uniref:6,7-dimethyl-8-ribityllumazine synthase n=1 Tax=Hyphomicrobiales TaxID=356 RepID=UPI00068D5937|nr:6,7-dimethyl-8-ribityllumazine synthase [Rhizobium sp. WW_1]RKD74047.1 6,7-dimethyl-8-ribityllumazine synthase [Rhizobium sp. WW_1]
MRHSNFAFIKAAWHSEVVDRALDGFLEVVSERQVEVFTVPGALELPLLARDLAATKRFDAVVATAFVVDGGIYRHDFVAQAVIDGLVRAGLETGVPVLSVSLTPHNYQETEFHTAIYREHFVTKGREAAEAALKITRLRAECGLPPASTGKKDEVRYA